MAQIKVFVMKIVLPIFLATSFCGTALADDANLNDKGHWEFGPSMYRPNYLIYQWGDSDPRDGEMQYAKFQISIKQLIFDIGAEKVGVYLAFTQRSLWSITAYSAPFKDSNYEPELFFDLNTYHYRKNEYSASLGQIGISHESNGRSVDYDAKGNAILTSREWARVYLQPEIEFQGKETRVWSSLKVWRVLGNQNYLQDNPDIYNYYGNGELMIGFSPVKKLEALALIRKGARTNGNIELDLAYWLWGDHRFAILMQFWKGYGETLLDYNKFTTRYGIGFEFSPLLPNRTE